jgi:hypothetical protein
MTLVAEVAGQVVLEALAEVQRLVVQVVQVYQFQSLAQR